MGPNAAEIRGRKALSCEAPLSGFVSLPSVSYLEAMEKEEYQRALQDPPTREAWSQSEDPLAHAFLLIAQLHRNAAMSDSASALERADDAQRVLEQAEEDWTTKALVQHVDQCKEYLSMGKPLPELPSGL